MSKKLFDYVIGNPPYMEITKSDSTRMPPVYNAFMDASYKVANKVELITPARFLFNAGYTPKAWNEKMLNDEHFKVLLYEMDASKVFPNTDIKGGVAVTYRDTEKNYGAVEIFTKYKELNDILRKIKGRTGCILGLDTIINSSLNFQLTDLMKSENPNLIDRLRTSAFTTLEPIFFEKKPNDEYEYISMVGLLKNKRVVRYVRKDYIRENGNTLERYTLLLPKANGAGHFGETLSPAIIAEPGMAYTQTFIGIGSFLTYAEAANVELYIKTKFARAMLGILKITQDNPGPKWKYVPLQDFTSQSDIDWSKSIPKIDQQLYKKYGLDENEINVIETHVKEMV